MKHLSLFLGAIAFLLMGSSVATAQGNGNGSQVFDVPMDFELENPCCGDIITLTGTLHYVYTKNGNAHVNAKDFNATNENGDVYHGNVSAGYHDKGNAKGQYSYNYIERWRFSSNNGCSFSLKLTVHLTVNANGEVVVDRTDVHIDCDEELS